VRYANCCAGFTGGLTRQVRGFLAPPTVSRLLSDAIEEVRSGQLPWASVVVWGFEDTPLSWGSSSHCFADGERVSLLGWHACACVGACTRTRGRFVAECTHSSVLSSYLFNLSTS
jgi:hypothetical protein